MYADRVQTLVMVLLVLLALLTLCVDSTPVAYVSVSQVLFRVSDLLAVLCDRGYR